MGQAARASATIQHEPVSDEPLVIEGEGHGGPAFTERDAADLETYFRSNLPPAYGATSLAGAMIERLGESTNQKTKELPTRDCWDDDGVFHRHEDEWMTVESSQGHGNPSSVEDSFLAFIDARGRVRRAHRVLVRLPQKHFDVLEARYALPAPTTEHLSARQRIGTAWEVAQLMPSAARMRADFEISEGRDFSRRDALIRCVHLSVSKQPEAAAARLQIREVVTEARDAIARAESAYALMARWTGGQDVRR